MSGKWFRKSPPVIPAKLCSEVVHQPCQSLRVMGPDELSYAVLEPKTPYNRLGVRFAAYLLELEAEERDDNPPNLTQTDIQEGVDAGIFKVAVAHFRILHVGVALVERPVDSNEYDLSRLYVVPRQRNQGVGKRLLAETGIELPAAVLPETPFQNADSSLAAG